MESKLGGESNEHLVMQTKSGKNNGVLPATLSSQKHLESEPGKISNKPLKIQTQSGTKSELGGESNKQLSSGEEGENEGYSLSFSSSPSSTSSGSPFDDEEPLRDFLVKSDQDGSRSNASDPLYTPEFSTQTPAWSMVSASPRNGTGTLTSGELSSEWGNINASPMRSPPIQTMGQPGGYDPNRIPASVFTSKPATPMEWSIASNDSLFSIQMGNSSFSRDHPIMLAKSGELTKPEERNNVNNFSSSLPPLPEVASDTDGKIVNMKENLVVKEEPSKNLKPIQEENVELKAIAVGNIEKRDNKVYPVEEVHSPSAPLKISDSKGLPPPNRTRTASSPRLSHESGKSNSSFAFPVLVNDVGGISSSKMVSEKPEEPQPQPEVPKETTKAANTSWFSCLMCWPRCC